MSKEERMDKSVNNQFQIKNSENMRLIVGWIKSVEDSKTEIQKNFKENISSLEKSIEETQDCLSRLEENDIKKIYEDINSLRKDLSDTENKLKSDFDTKLGNVQKKNLANQVAKTAFEHFSSTGNEVKPSLDDIQQMPHNETVASFAEDSKTKVRSFCNCV
jgi:septal ring factor EnvC (AmiA/AmiB activator)